MECELEDQHAGLHMALAQAQDRAHDDVTNWWLTWGDGVRRVTHEPTCRFEVETDAAFYCLLPVEHDRAHSDGERWIARVSSAPPARRSDRD